VADDARTVIDDLRAERERLGITQTEVARRMGVTQHSVSQIERHQTDLLLSTLQRYHRAVTGKRLRVSLVPKGKPQPYPTPVTWPRMKADR
jgi:predicted transcriptional regulator